jgi:hypothetical protein
MRERGSVAESKEQAREYRCITLYADKDNTITFGPLLCRRLTFGYAAYTQFRSSHTQLHCPVRRYV